MKLSMSHARRELLYFLIQDASLILSILFVIIDVQLFDNNKSKSKEMIHEYPIIRIVMAHFICSFRKGFFFIITLCGNLRRWIQINNKRVMIAECLCWSISLIMQNILLFFICSNLIGWSPYHITFPILENENVWRALIYAMCLAIEMILFLCFISILRIFVMLKYKIHICSCRGDDFHCFKNPSCTQSC